MATRKKKATKARRNVSRPTKLRKVKAPPRSTKVLWEVPAAKPEPDEAALSPILIDVLVDLVGGLNELTKAVIRLTAEVEEHNLAQEPVAQTERRPAGPRVTIASMPTPEEDEEEAAEDDDSGADEEDTEDGDGSGLLDEHDEDVGEHEGLSVVDEDDLEGDDDDDDGEGDDDGEDIDEAAEGDEDED